MHTHYEAAKSAFVALKDKVGPISLLDTPGIRKANRHAETAPADSLAAQVTSENPLAAQYADTILRRIVCCDTPETLEQYPDSATRDLLRHHPFRLERLRTPQRYIGLEARRARAGALCLPSMLILDEATSSIDTRTEIRVQKAFSRMMEGRTSFIVAHRLSTIREADVILVMRDGRIVEKGRHKELLRKNGYYAEIYNSQFAPSTGE